MLIVFRGLPGTGKTHLVEKLRERRADLLVLSRDRIRATVFSHPTFADDEKVLVDDLILSMARFLMGRGCSVVIDGMALSSAARLEDFANAAGSQRTSFCIIECVCSEATALSRISADAGSHPAGDRAPELYYRTRDRYESTDLPFLRVDTDGDAEENVSAVVGYIENPPV